MVAIGPSLRLLEQCFSFWGSSTEDGSCGMSEIQETTKSPSPSLLSPRFSSSSTSLVRAPGSSTAHGSLKDSRSGKEMLQNDHGGGGRPQDSFKDPVDSIRFRRLFSHDID